MEQIADVVSCNPDYPPEVLVYTPATSWDGVVRTVERARVAAREWWHSGATHRAAALHAAAERVEEARDILIDLISREVGKPSAEARGEVARAVAILRYYAQQPYDPIGAVHEPAQGRGMLLTRRSPHGVAGLITPWNFPLAIPVWKAAPALAAGNAVVLKPAPPATACALELAPLLAEVLPEGLFTVVPGHAETGAALVESADVVSFTGSTAVGRAVVQAATASGTPVQAEMGGQNAAIVMPDAEIDETATQIAGAIAGYAGQKCTATKRVIVVGDPAPLRGALVEALKSIEVGPPAAAGTVCGPVISAQARAAVLESVAGARVLAGGFELGSRQGWYIAPTLVDELDDGHPLLRNEIFGPVAALVAVPDLDSALAAANGVVQGLVSSVHTSSLGTALRCADELDTGLIKVNAPTTGVDFHVPFGGEKESSHGSREQGKAGMDFFTRTRTITLRQSTAV